MTTNSNIHMMHDKQKRTFEYIESLPQSAIPIIEYEEKEIYPGYFYDFESDRIIKTAMCKSPYPYRYNRSNELILRLSSGGSVKVEESHLRAYIKSQIKSSEILSKNNVPHANLSQIDSLK